MSGDCQHRWVPAEGHRGCYYCADCPATGRRRACVAIDAHKRPHPELRPREDVPEAQPKITKGRSMDGYYSTDGAVPPKPRSR